MRFNFTIEENTFKAMQKNAPALKILSHRAIQNELQKIPESQKSKAKQLISKLGWEIILSLFWIYRNIIKTDLDFCFYRNAKWLFI